MFLRPFRLIQAFVLAVIGLLAIAPSAHAVPSFASQTGQPCTACHIGAFGPQLTAYGRAFKIGGYTQTGGEGVAAKIPLAAFIQGSYTHTQADQNGGAAPGYAGNNNFALDAVSVFLAGRITDYAGAFIQTTYAGVGKSYFLDNSDIRVTTPIDIGDTNLRLGMSVNNGPTVQDPFNSSMVWGPPYEGSSLAPTPAYEPVLMGAFQGSVLGVTAYGWYDNALYVEAGAYKTMDDKIAKALGVYGAPGTMLNPGPYVRLAYEWDWGGQSAHVGMIGLQTAIQPGGTIGFGTDTYTDIALDGSYQWVGDGKHTVSVIGSWTHEHQNLAASFIQGLASNQNNTLDEFRGTVSYYYKSTYGGQLGIKEIWGNADALYYNASPSGKPNSTGIIAELDYVPFGKDDSWKNPWANLKLGLQYTFYPMFNGTAQGASGNNTIYAFAWLSF